MSRLMSHKDDEKSSPTPQKACAGQAHCDNCNVSTMKDQVTVILETDMAKLQAAGEGGCQLCELAFKCVASREEYLVTGGVLGQPVSLHLTRCRDSIVAAYQTSEAQSIRRVSMNPSFTPKYDNTPTIDSRPHLVPDVFLSLYTRTYQAREYCRLSSKGTAIELQLEKSPRNIASMADSDQCFELIDKWIKNCVEGHSSCSSTTVKPLPTRVLDLGKSLDGKTLHLVETSGQLGKYAALSHCWGGGYVPRTFQYVSQSEEASVRSRMQGFPISQLSNTFKDAVCICRKLSIRYLWIDSLCIFQDVENREDWERESAKMASVYENAFITIAATSASSGKAGCLGARPIITSRLDEFQSTGGNSIYVREKLDHKIIDWYFSIVLDFSSVPLLHRAWCYQERLLSGRVVHFTKSELLWECNSVVKCECEEVNECSDGKPRYSKFLSEIQLGSGESAKGKLERLAPVWRYLTCIYSGMGLTNASDIFPALSGVASKFQCSELGKYLAGIWEHDLAEGLAWTTLPQRKPRRLDPVDCSYRAPSWTWASVVGPTCRTAHNKPARKASPLRLLDIQCTPKGVNALGEITFGYIRVSALIISAKIYTASPYTKLVVKRSKGKNWESKFEFDVEMDMLELEAVHGRIVFLLRLLHTKKDVQGLVLKRAEGYVEKPKPDGGTFERLGMFDDAPVELFDGVEEAEIGLI